jgi:uncharacterized protein (TIGR02646 family)
VFELTNKPRVPATITKATIKTKRNNANPWKSSAKGVVAFKEYLIDHMSLQTNKCCCYCSLEALSTSGFELDHFIPQNVSMRWVYHPQNLILSCHRCNSIIKGKYNPVKSSGGTYNQHKFKLFHPYLNRFDEHFFWSWGNIFLNHKTPKGKFSIKFFKVNAQERIQQRMCQFIKPSLSVTQMALHCSIMKSIETNNS